MTKGGGGVANYDYVGHSGGVWVSQILICMTKGEGGLDHPKICMMSYVNSSYIFILQYIWRKYL